MVTITRTQPILAAFTFADIHLRTTKSKSQNGNNKEAAMVVSTVSRKAIGFGAVLAGLAVKYPNLFFYTITPLVLGSVSVYYGLAQYKKNHERLGKESENMSKVQPHH
eukprot:CAMPEP_0184696996 /NCGR_PEP_ID=MMETSP0313-20130426/4129_1 /TAXON_ID=2792 /ORGANISM="Porphyridium aerugineum, Strain SAG 1380-2" /LENGTH=107 /DNA_ID=CAMNT_0027155755 /DNA_START=219 /DNA_END=542 /DNA_ORIENTATION=-